MRNRTVWLLVTGLIVAAPSSSRGQDQLKVSFGSGSAPNREVLDSDDGLGPKRIAILLSASSMWPAVISVQPSPEPLLASAIAPLSARAALVGSDEGQIPGVRGAPPQLEARPRGLLALYAGFATLQVLDAHSTLQAVQSGYEESNPLVAPFAQSPAAMYAFKAASTTATILLVEKLGRKHRGAAIGLMIAVNVAYASVVAHNYRQSSR